MLLKNEIKSIIFSEFHHEAGPKIVYQIPDECLSKEEFDSIHVYIITKPALQGHVITINAFNYKIIGCPVIINNPKYKRNAFIFNLSLVFDSDLDTTPYEKIVRKLAEYMKAIEIGCEFLSKEETRCQLPALLRQIHDELNTRGWCSIFVNESTVINLKVVKSNGESATIHDCDVPIFLPNCGGLGAIPADHLQLDLTIQLLADYIDGFRYIGKIAAEADMDINIVKATIQNLIYCGSLRLISIFQYSNVYVTTGGINQLVQDLTVQEECIRFVAKPGKEPTFRDVFLLYCSLGSGITVKDMCNRFSPQTKGIDERKLMQYGEMKGFIRRLYKYPIRSVSNMEGVSKKFQDVLKMCNGKHHSDEICFRTGLSSHELDDIIDSDMHMVTCWK